MKTSVSLQNTINKIKRKENLKKKITGNVTTYMISQNVIWPTKYIIFKIYQLSNKLINANENEMPFFLFKFRRYFLKDNISAGKFAVK